MIMAENKSKTLSAMKAIFKEALESSFEMEWLTWIKAFMSEVDVDLCTSGLIRIYETWNSETVLETSLAKLTGKRMADLDEDLSDADNCDGLALELEAQAARLRAHTRKWRKEHPDN